MNTKPNPQEVISRTVGQSFAHTLPVAPVKRAEGDDSRTVPIAITSDTPVLHGFGYLVLNHSPSAIRMERMKAGAPLLLEHDREDKIGGLFNVQTDGHVLRADAKFSRREKAENELKDIEDGIGRGISGGFLVHHLVLVEERDSDYDIYRSDDWEPIEASLVSIPADITVGVGRNLTTPHEPETREESADGNTAEPAESVCASEDETQASDQTRAENAPIITRSEMPEVLDNHQTNDEALLAIGERFSERELAQQFALAGKSPQELRDAILAKRTTSQAPTPTSPVQLTEKEEKEYSVSRAISSMLKGENCFEREVGDEVRKKLPANADYRGGILVPTAIRAKGFQRAIEMQRAGLEVKTASAGGRAVFTEYGGFIDLLRNKAMVAQLGATFLPGLQGNVSFVRQATAGVAYWLTENTGTDVTQADATIELVTLSPKNLMAMTSYSRQLLAQSTIDIDAFVMNDLAAVNALAIDRAVLHGATDGLTGLYAESGVNAVAFGGSTTSGTTTGGVPTFAKMVSMETAVAEANADDLGSMAYLTTPGMRGLLKTTLEASASGAKMIWSGGEINGYRAEASNNVSKTMTASATTGGTAHGILFGTWNCVLMGEWGAMEITADPYTLLGQGMVRVVSYLLVDQKVKYGPAFAKATMATLT